MVSNCENEQSDLDKEFHNIYCNLDKASKTTPDDDHPGPTSPKEKIGQMGNVLGKIRTPKRQPRKFLKAPPSPAHTAKKRKTKTDASIALNPPEGSIPIVENTQPVVPAHLPVLIGNTYVKLEKIDINHMLVIVS